VARSCDPPETTTQNCWDNTAQQQHNRR